MLTPWKILSTIMAIGLIAAPLIALTLDPVLGLAILASALTAVIYLAWTSRDQVAPELRPKLQTMIYLNLGALILTIAAIFAIALT